MICNVVYVLIQSQRHCVLKSRMILWRASSMARWNIAQTLKVTSIWLSSVCVYAHSPYLFNSLLSFSTSDCFCTIVKLQNLSLARNDLLSLDLTSCKATRDTSIVASSGTYNVSPILVLNVMMWHLWNCVFLIVHCL